MAAKRKPGGKGKEIVLDPLELRRIHFRIVGDSPLLVHAFGAKAKEEMLANQQGPKKRAKEARTEEVIEAEYQAAFYRDGDGDCCVPSVNFKQAVVAAGMRFYDLSKVFLNGILRVCDESVKLHYESVERDARIVRLADMKRTAMVRFRPLFRGWWFDVTIEFDASVLNEKQVAEFVRRAGFSVGIFEWRPEKGGEFGQFHIATEAESKAIERNLKRGKYAA